MNDLLIIINTERRSLLRGFIVVFMLAFPFTLLPFVIRHGFSTQYMGLFLPDSLLYAALFAVGIVFIALLNNYEKLLQKKRLYDLPAFAALNFSGAVEGYNSIIRELSTFLIGKVGDYFFRVNIVDPSKKELKIEVSPLIYVGTDTELLNRLMQELHLQEDLYLSIILRISEEELQQKDVLLNEIKRVSSELTKAGVTPLAVEDIKMFVN